MKGGVTHYGLYDADGVVIHNSKKLRLVKESTLEEFSDGYSISISSGITAKNRALAVQTARKYLGLPYHLWNDNCEHFVRVACGLIKESTQVQKFLITALGAGVLLKSENVVLRTAGGTAAVVAMLTPSEESPVKSAIILSCLTAGIAFLAT